MLQYVLFCNQLFLLPHLAPLQTACLANHSHIPIFIMLSSYQWVHQSLDLCANIREHGSCEDVNKTITVNQKKKSY
jgi:hypothetical protein